MFMSNSYHIINERKSGIMRILVTLPFQNLQIFNKKIDKDLTGIIEDPLSAGPGDLQGIEPEIDTCNFIESDDDSE